MLTNFSCFCPTCKETLVTFEIDSTIIGGQKITILPNNPSIPFQDKFIFSKREMIPRQTQATVPVNQCYAELGQGSCLTCKKPYWGLFVYYVSRPVVTEYRAGEGEFVLLRDVDSQSVSYHKLSPDLRGYKILHHDAHIEGDSESSQLEIAEYILGPFAYQEKEIQRIITDVSSNLSIVAPIELEVIKIIARVLDSKANHFNLKDSSNTAVTNKDNT